MDGAHHTILQGFGWLDIGASDGILDLSVAQGLFFADHYCTIACGSDEAVSADLKKAQNRQHHRAEDQREAKQVNGALWI